MQTDSPKSKVCAQKMWTFDFSKNVFISPAQFFMACLLLPTNKRVHCTAKHCKNIAQQQKGQKLCGHKRGDLNLTKALQKAVSNKNHGGTMDPHLLLVFAKGRSSTSKSGQVFERKTSSSSSSSATTMAHEDPKMKWQSHGPWKG